jgi:hypothetical protein
MIYESLVFCLFVNFVASSPYRQARSALRFH